jgi:hypothetical protein
MGDDRKAEGVSLRRWSQRKHAAARDGHVNADARRPDAAPATRRVERDESAAALADAAPRAAAQPVRAEARALPPSTGALPAAAGAESKPALPPVESLTVDSDFTAFMQAGVDENVRRSALRKLLRDPRFNVMDGLDTYIDDYSIPSPIEPEVVRTLRQARYLFDPPKTRITADGVVEDVPEHEAEDVPEHDAADAPEHEATDAPEHEARRDDGRDTDDKTSLATGVEGSTDMPTGAPVDLAQRHDDEQVAAAQHRNPES